ncbi:kinase-like domain-containing protein [Podospora didyma]|uniref:Kinase-like domain-containing protein n=1 Tax=Podospora didyma TaxID=330526 RepID=A0AAE0KAX8_9PEZI|nr:kinase-like domain-containing protein [Podospora didyma]
MGRICASCGRDLPRTSYTSNQYVKGEGISRCATCVHGHHSDTYPRGGATQSSSSGRYNRSNQAKFTQDALEYPFASGAFRWVAQGQYNRGDRAGQACVAKWFKTGGVFSADYFTLDIKAVDKALEIVNRFNDLSLIDKKVMINVPEVWTFQELPGGEDGRDDSDWVGQKCLQEPFIQNYEKFNSNTGWTDDNDGWPEVMQALSHFSYHVSGGMYVLCDLQGGIYQTEVVLSDPVILSRTREFGVTDLGADGISSFFSAHVCNDFCRPHWTRPANPTRYFRPVPGTTMLRRDVTTDYSRPAASGRY